jgi:hypothetical protein
MDGFLRTLIEKCEFGFHKDAAGWHLSAKGALGLATLLIFLFVCAHLL